LTASVPPPGPTRFGFGALKPSGVPLTEIDNRVADTIAAQIVSGRRVEARVVEKPSTKSSQALVAAAEAAVLSALPKRVDESFLSSALGVDRRTLRDAFWQVRGLSIYRAILNVRLLAVCRVLERHPALAPAVVSRWCGFATLGQFTKEHRALFGLGPKSSVKSDVPRAHPAAS
jgi:transcriptional regulator GlxA family with amidase domain